MAVLPGCSSLLAVGEPDFSCPRAKAGGACLSVHAAYTASDGGIAIPPAAPTAAAAQAQPAPVAREPQPAGVPQLLPVLDRPLPIRTQAKVMRIAIFPWEDEHGNLNATGYVFTEIEPRRWSIGSAQPAPEPVLRPLQTAPGLQRRGAERPAAPVASTATPLAPMSPAPPASTPGGNAAAFSRPGVQP